MDAWVRLPKVLEELPSLPDGLRTTAEGQDAPEVEAQALQDKADLAGLCDRLGWTFRNPSLLRVALTHPGWANEHRKAGWPSNGCLEYYGDAVLDLLTADAIWRRFPGCPEGDLTRLRASLVSEGSLCEVARELDLGSFLYLGRGDEKNGFRDHPATLADTLEAVIGALFLDAKVAGEDPFRAAAGCFESIFGARVAGMSPTDGLDPKSALQRLVQARTRSAPRYRQVGEAPAPGAEPHWRVTVEVRVKGLGTQALADGEGRSLQEAERQAASSALGRIREGGFDFLSD